MLVFWVLWVDLSSVLVGILFVHFETWIPLAVRLVGKMWEWL